MRFILFFGLFISYFKSPAQELAIMAGMANYHGDIQHALFTTEMAKPVFSANIKYRILDHLYGRTGISFGSIGAKDPFDISTNYRNLSFSSNIREISTGLEYRLLDPDRFPITPYAFACIGWYHFDPTTVYNGQVVRLQPLGTEGEGLSQDFSKKLYSLNQVCIPLGGGLMWQASDNLNLGVEYGVRILFTDYLDDISGSYVDESTLLAARGQLAVNLAYRGNEISPSLRYPNAGTSRGNALLHDAYYFLGITAGMRFFDDATGAFTLGGIFKKSTKHYRMGCPNRVM